MYAPVIYVRPGTYPSTLVSFLKIIVCFDAIYNPEDLMFLSFESGLKIAV